MGRTGIRWAGKDPCRAAPALWLAILGSLMLSGCGRILQTPTPTRVVGGVFIPTETQRPTATRRATFTPVPATPSATPTPTVTPTPIIYTLKKGDTLLAVARLYGVTVRDLQDANGITDPRRLHIGQEIIIPLAEGGGEPTSVPTPTPVALKTEGLAFYTTPVGSLWCVGEVLNLSGQPAEEVQVQVSLHDGEGQLLASAAAFTQLDILAAGGRSPFGILFSAPPTSFAQYQVRVLSGVHSTHLGPRYPYLAVVEKQGTQDQAGNYWVRGLVRNTGAADAEKVAIVVTLFDGDDHVVGARTVGIPAEVFIAGATAPFDMTLTPFGDVARFSVEVQGWRVDYQVPTATWTPEATATP